MRISDWSSDVCSSDLDFSFTRRKVIVVALPETEGLVYGTLGLLGVRNQNATAAAGGTRRRLKLPFRLGKFVSEYLVGMARLDRELLAADNAQEIGSASCRERVCQYV